ncbi:MAG: cytochrome b [Mariprofundus sp.]|nr:cytochrome b [Mariprofundus sp.]
MLRNTPTSYGLLSMLLHWSMAIVVFGMFGLGLWMVELNYYDRWYHDAPYIHKGMGMLLLMLLLCRISWRLMNVRPDLMGEAWERVIALAVHRLHYVLLFGLTITGYLIPTAEGVGIDVFGWFTVPALFTFSKAAADLFGLLHLYLAWAVMVLAAAHSAAALKHHFVDEDTTLLRMLGIHPRRRK